MREENNRLSTSLSGVEQKYVNEMILHSTDIQQLDTVKEELSKVRGQINSLKSEEGETLHKPGKKLETASDEEDFQASGDEEGADEEEGAKITLKMLRTWQAELQSYISSQHYISF